MGSRQELEQLQLECIPLPVMFGETVYQENVNLTKDEFYRLLTTGSDFPHTSRPTPHDLTKRLKQARDHGDEISAEIPSGRIGRPEDMAAAAVYLASDAGDYVVGSTLTVDGGVNVAR